MNKAEDIGIITRKIYYYRFKGEINTDHVIRVAIQRALEVGVSALIVASETAEVLLRQLRLLEI